MKKKNLKVKDIGEWHLIDKIFKIISKSGETKLPYGDDAVAISIQKDVITVINVDMLVASTDVPIGMTSEQIGRKVIVMCISDLAAKGAKPIGFLSSIGLEREMPVIEFEKMIYGMENAAKEYGLTILGGDVNEACDLIVDGIAIGIAKRVIPRNNAKIGDIVAVTGLFGNTGAGFKILLNKMNAPTKIRSKILRSVYLPKAHVKEGIALASNNLISASIDSSDGLAISLHELAKKSKVGIEIDTMPISNEAKIFAEENNIDPFELVFYGGEEYNLIITLKEEKLIDAIKAVKKVGGLLLPIGRVTTDIGHILFNAGGEVREIENKGWEHFT